PGLRERALDVPVVRRIRHRGEEPSVEDDAAERLVVLVLVPRAAGDLHEDDDVGHARTAAGTSACSRSAMRSVTDSMPTDRRTRFGGAANGAVAVEACVIFAGTSIRLSTPPSDSASWKIFVRPTSATASSAEAARNETMPPKS